MNNKKNFQAAYVEGLNGAEFFESLFIDDVEGQKLNLIPGADELIAEFQENFIRVCKEMYEFGIKEKDIRDKEVAEFWNSMNAEKQLNTLEASNAISKFMEIKKKVKVSKIFKKLYFY